MSASATLMIECLERLEDLGRGRAWSPSHVAHHGEPRSTYAVHDALERLYELGRVERPRWDRYVLVAVREVGEFVHEQMEIGG